MNATREGRFKATVIEQGVDMKGQNALTCFSAKFLLTDEYIDGEWQVLPPDESDLDIVGDFYIEKKDGTINTFAVETLKEVFGWDGLDPFWLQDTNLAKIVVQVTLENETWENSAGKSSTRLKVKWLNPGDSTGGPAGVTKANDEDRKKISAKLGRVLRALNGGAPVPSAAPRGKPSPPAAAPKKAPIPAAPTATLDEAWAKFLGTRKVDEAEDAVATAWIAFVAKVFPTIAYDSLTPENWHTVITRIDTAKPLTRDGVISEDSKLNPADIPF